VKILVAEDERPQRDELVRLLAELWPEATLVAACSDGLEALEAIDREAPDVAFLDIRMPEMSGLDLARLVAGRVHVVFVTAYDEHAVTAFEHGAVDYLLKPVQRARLATTIERLGARRGAAPAQVIDELIERLRRELAPATPALRWITASIGDTVKMIPIDEVVAFRTQDKYTQVLTAGDDALIRRSLRDLLGQLDRDVFWQVHRSVVVRVSAIDTVQRDDSGRYSLTLKGRRDALPVAAAFHGRFRGM
jgi:DNA-binding LytR/AlgR family response regulator